MRNLRLMAFFGVIIAGWWGEHGHFAHRCADGICGGLHYAGRKRGR